MPGCIACTERGEKNEIKTKQYSGNGYIRYDRPVPAAANYELSPPEQDGGWSVVGVIPASEKIF